MSERVDVTRIGRLAYGAAVHGRAGLTHHVVTMSEAILDDLLMPHVETGQVAEQAIRYLLDREPGAAIPEVVDLDQMADHDGRFLPELHARLARG